MNLDEAERRMPAVEWINDLDLEKKTLRLISEFPDYFWMAPATQHEDYHNRFCREEHGLWIHVLMAATCLERSLDSWTQQGLVDNPDHARVAVLLHDGLKYGHEYHPGDSSESDHDIMMADWCRSQNYPEPIYGAIESHMGPWYDGKQPQPAGIEQAVHQADMMASAPHITAEVYNPPIEILQKYPDIPRWE